MPKLTPENLSLAVGIAAQLLPHAKDAEQELSNRSSGNGLNHVEYTMEIEEKAGRKPPSPIAKPWEVLELSLSEELSGNCSARIEIFSDAPPAEPRALMGRSVRLTMKRPQGSQRRFGGVVRGVASRGYHGQGLFVEILVEPAFFSLETLRRRSFTNMTVPEIVDKVLGAELSKFNRDLKWSSTRLTEKEPSPWRFARRERCVQYGETDCNFIRRILGEEGVGYYFDHSGERECIVFFDSNEQVPERKDPVWIVPHGVASNAEGLRDIALSYGRMPYRVAVGGFDFSGTGRADRMFVAQPPYDDTAQVEGDAGQHEVRDFGAAVPLHGFEDTAYKESTVESQATIRLQEARRDGERATGTGQVVEFSAGFVFTFMELAGNQPMDGETGRYLITRITHTGRAWRAAQLLGVPADDEHSAHHNEFTCIPAYIPFRPTRLKKPAPRSFDVALVVESGDDPFGRVKVIFQFDEDEQQSSLVPVVLPWAGARYGTQLIPRPGMFVTVAYQDGDIDHPVITGCLVTDQSQVPSDLPAMKTKSTWRSQSFRTEGALEHSHEISMDDAAEKELLFVKAGFNFKRKVLNDDRTEVDHDEHRSVSNNQTIEVGGQRKLIVAKRSTTEHHDVRETTVDKDDLQTFHADQVINLDNGSRRTEIKKDDIAVVQGQRELTVEGDDIISVTKHRSVSVGEKLTVRQAATIVEWAEGHLDVTTESWMRLRHAGAEIFIDEDGRITVSTNEDIMIAAPKVAIKGEQEVSISVADSSIKVDASGVTTSANNVTTTASTMCQTTAGLIVDN